MDRQGAAPRSFARGEWTYFLLVTAVAAVTSPSDAHAHSQMKGVGDVYVGLLHPVLTVSHALTLCALSVLLAQQGERERWRSFLGFASAAAAGLLLAAFSPGLELEPWFLLVMSCALGALASSGRPFNWLLLEAIALVTGTAIGFDSGVERGTLSGLVKVSLGTLAAVSYVVFVFPAYLSRARQSWHRIALRVVGSWVFAISLLALAFELKPPR